VGFREEIQRIYEQDGLDDLWRWAKGHQDRWEALKEWADAKASHLETEREKARKRHEQASEALHQLAEQAADLTERIAKNREGIERAEESGDEAAVTRLRQDKQKLMEEREKLKERVESRKVQEDKAVLRAEHAREEQKAWLERKIIYRDKWEAAKRREREKQKPKWEDFMASGHSLNLGGAAKAEAAIAVVKFDCVVSSTYRATVIPQSNPNSFHGPNVSPGKAVDLVGSRMTEYQKDVFDRRRGDGHLLELFGPTNSLALKNGAPTALAEGTFLENLHDTHVHVAAE
jgi:hypothetical protein